MAVSNSCRPCSLNLHETVPNRVGIGVAGSDAGLDEIPDVSKGGSFSGSGSAVTRPATLHALEAQTGEEVSPALLMAS